MSEHYCPKHGRIYSKDKWWQHGNECSDMCVNCDEFHTNDVGCAFVNVSLNFMRSMNK